MAPVANTETTIEYGVEDRVKTHATHLWLYMDTTHKPPNRYIHTYLYNPSPLPPRAPHTARFHIGTKYVAKRAGQTLNIFI